MPDNFYIGYQDRVPRRLTRSIIAISSVLMIGAAVLGVILVRSQDPFYQTTFEFGVVRSYSGWIQNDPVPMLTLDAVDGRAGSTYLLVAEGKHGAGPLVTSAVNQHVILRGTLIHRTDMKMLEVEAGSVEPVPGAAQPPAVPVQSLGQVTLKGEIVDSKCFLGVMNPGEKTVHRACAQLCIRGGIPPMLLVRESDTKSSLILLSGADGQSINLAVLPYVAIPVSVSGELISRGEFMEMRINPTRIRLLSSP